MLSTWLIPVKTLFFAIKIGFTYLTVLKFLSKKDWRVFHDGGDCHVETSPLICSANHWTGFYMIGTSVTKELSIANKNKNC